MKQTLVEELEEAANLAITLAHDEDSSALAWGEKSRGDMYRDFARRLRARINLVAKLVDQHRDYKGKAYDEGWQDALDIVDQPIE